MKVSGRFITGFVLFFLVFSLYKIGKFEKLELINYDWRLRKSTIKDKDLPIVVIGITEDFEREIGEPFSRKFYSRILKILKQEKTDLVVFDIFFPTFSSKNKEDVEFLKGIKENGKVILPVFSPVKIEKKKGNIYTVDFLRGSVTEYQNVALSVGHINTFPDNDQVVRRLPGFIKFKDKVYPQIAIEVYNQLYKKNTSDFSRILDEDGCFYVRYLSPEVISTCFISFSDVLKGRYEKDFFKNKVVIIGQTMVGAKNADLIPTPLGTQFGVFVQASAISTIISGKYILKIPFSTTVFILILFSFFLSFLFSSFKVSLNTFYFFCLTGFVFLFSGFLMRNYGIFIETIPFLFLTFFHYLFFIFYNLINAIKKLFQREEMLKIMKNVEEEVAEILNPVESFREKDIAFLGFGSEEMIEKTPSMVLRTILLSTGVEAGCFLSFSSNRMEIIAREGELIDKIDFKEYIRDSEQPVIINKIKDEKIRNLAIVPVLSFPDFKIYSIFVNKKPTIFSNTYNFSKEDLNLMQALSLQGIIAIQNAKLNLILKNTQIETIIRLAIAIEYRDRETGAHIHRVSEYAGLIAKGIGFKENEIELIKNAMPLHDIGKIAIPDEILLKPEKLTKEERKIVEMHPVIGAKMLEGSNSLVLKAAEIIALSHHERYDGTGYPFNLSGNQIPIYGRIAALSDVFDALISKRIYKKPVEIEEAFEIINNEKGKSFDPKIVDIFLKFRKEIIEINKKYQEQEKLFEIGFNLPY